MHNINGACCFFYHFFPQTKYIVISRFSNFDTNIDIALFGCLISGKGTEQTKFRYAVLFGKPFLIVSQDFQNVFTGQHNFSLESTPEQPTL